MSHPQHIYPKLVPSVEEYVAGLLSIEPKMTDNQRRMLVAHHNAPCHIMTPRELSASVGYKGNAANIHYGKLGQLLAAAMGVDKYWAVDTLVFRVSPGVGENPHEIWVMRDNVAHALEELNWAPQTADLFFPFGDPDQPLTPLNEGDEATIG